MKKSLTATLVLALVAILLGTFVACGDTPENTADAATAQRAIAQLTTLYGGAHDGAKTDSDFNVIGKVAADGKLYSVTWTVQSNYANYAEYITVGQINDDNQITIGIKKAAEEITYTLTASVAVGKVTKTATFTRKISASQVTSDEETEATIAFADLANRTSFSTSEQVWLQNDIKLTNSGSCGDYYNPIRIYVGSNTKIEYPGMIKLVFHSQPAKEKDDYPENLNKCLSASGLGTVTKSGDDITLTLTAPSDVVEFIASVQSRVLSIDVLAYKDGLTDEQKVAASKVALDLTTKRYIAVGTYDLPAEKHGATVTWAVKGESTLVSIKENKLSVDSLPAADTDVTLVATLKVKDATETKEIVISVSKDLGLEHAGTLADPYSIADIKKIGANNDNKVYVKGYVVATGTHNTQFNNWTGVYIVDEYAADMTAATEGAIQVYRLNTDGKYVTEAGLTHGDCITVYGYIQEYKGAVQISYVGQENPVCVALTHAVDERTDAQKVADALAALTLPLTYTVAGDVTLPTARGVEITWASSNTALVTVAADNKKMTVVSPLPAADTKVTITATVSSGEVTDTKTFEITVKKVAVAEPGTYNFVLDLSASERKAVYYFTGALSTNFLATSTNAAEAAEVVIAEATGGYTFKVDNKYIQLDTYTNSSNKTSIKVVLVDTSTAVWSFDPDLAVYTYSINNSVYYLGSYTYNGSTFNTISASETSRISGNNASAVGVTQFPMSFVKVPEKTNAEKVEAAKAAVDLAEKVYAEVADYTLSTTKNGVNLAWAVKETSEYVTVEGNTLKIVAVPETEDATVTLVVTLTLGEDDATVTDTKEINITVKAPKPFEAGTYKLALQQAKLGKKLYFAGTLSGNFAATTENPLLAADVVVAQTSDGYTFAVGDKYLELNASHNCVLVDTATKAWKYDYALELFVWTHITDKVYYLGTYNEYNTISASETSRISGSNAGEVGVNQFPAKFEKFDASTVPAADKVATALGKVTDTLPAISAVSDVTLPTSIIADVTFAWAVKAETTLPEGTTLENGVLKVTALPSENATVTLTVTATCGEATLENNTKDVTVTIEVNAPAVAWTKLTSANVSELKAGAEIILTYEAFAMGVLGGTASAPYMTKVDSGVTVSDSGVVTVADSAVIVIVEDAGNGKFCLKVGDKYLAASTASSKNNYLYLKDKQTDGSTEWEITVDDNGVAKIKATMGSVVRVLQYNTSSPRFSSYISGQKDPTIYVRVSTATE